jgi:hypothetical protein
MVSCRVVPAPTARWSKRTSGDGKGNEGKRERQKDRFGAGVGGQGGFESRRWQETWTVNSGAQRAIATHWPDLSPAMHFAPLLPRWIWARRQEGRPGGEARRGGKE